MQDYSIRASRVGAREGLARAIKRLLDGKPPVFACVGTDAVIGDGFGPLVGSILKEKLAGRVVALGSLDRPITAVEAKSAAEAIKRAFPLDKVVAIDAALGSKEEIGSIKVLEGPVKPGLGVSKNLPEIGDFSIVAVVAERGDGKNGLRSARLSLAYSLAKIVADAICDCFDSSSSVNSFDFGAS